MDCIFSAPLSDDDLFAVLDNEATTETLKHLETCPACTAKLERIRSFEQSIHTAMHRVDCPSEETLTDYLLSGENSKEVEKHLATCAHCQEEVSLLRTVFVVKEAQTSAQPATESMWQKAKDFFQSVEEQFVQILLPQPVLAFERYKGTNGQGNHVLTFAVGSVSVMLSLEKVADGLKINGTIVDSDGDEKWRDAHVELTSLADAARRYVVPVDDLETFIFNDILPGTFSLSIYAVGGQVLRLPKVELVT
jgi:hypothetical protein